MNSSKSQNELLKEGRFWERSVLLRTAHQNYHTTLLHTDDGPTLQTNGECSREQNAVYSLIIFGFLSDHF